MNTSPSRKTMSIGGSTYDLFVRTEHDLVSLCTDREVIALPLGSKIRVNNVIETCGGGAANTAVGLSRLGCDAHISSVIGSDQWGEALLKTLIQEGVYTDALTQVDRECSSFSIILSASSGERAILYEPGTNAHLHDATFDRQMASTMDWVYLNHIQEGSCIIQDDIIDILTQSESIRLTWNPGGCQFDMGINEKHMKALLERTTLLILNTEEARRFAHVDSDMDAIDTFLSTGVKIVCITNGKYGAMASDGNTIYHCGAVKGDSTDTTGAGDAFGTGMTWALLHDMDIPTALKAGTCNASHVLTAIGSQTGLLREDEMKNRLKSIKLAIESEYRDK
jgi:ribokinase